MTKIECPCCQNYTIEDWGEEVIVDICPVCYWQYDVVGQKQIEIAIGPNKVSLVQARENYKEFGASEERLLSYVREPFDSELPKNNE